MTAQAPPPAATDRPLEFQSREASLRILGFWFFLASDVLLFACLFAVWTVYRDRTAGGPGPHQLFALGPVLVETLLLLTSSFTCGLMTHCMRHGRLRALLAWLLVTAALGIGFVSMEVAEFRGDAAAGATWHVSAFLSSFFALVGTHGAHVSFGILWALALAVQLARRGLGQATARKLYTFSLYWHFLDIVWIFIFTAVYLTGHAG